MVCIGSLVVSFFLRQSPQAAQVRSLAQGVAHLMVQDQRLLEVALGRLVVALIKRDSTPRFPN